MDHLVSDAPRGTRVGGRAAHAQAQRRPIALLASFLLTGSAWAWNKDGYPDCVDKLGPDCTPNRRAPHHHSLLDKLFNKYCSDKGTYWLSKHNYGAAYDTVLRPTRRRTRHLVELGVGDETAGSLTMQIPYLLASGSIDLMYEMGSLRSSTVA